jgi:hypothetical protein
MKFTRENYELYVIDYLEGKLTDHDYELFIQFLKENPDINCVIEEVRKIQLQPIDIKFHSKNNLKKNDRLSKFDNEFDNLCIAYTEGDLELNEKKKFESWLSANPERLIEFELFRKSRLLPDKSIIFSTKSKLKRLTLIQKRIRLISAISAAAVIILALILTINKGIKPDDLITKKADTNIKTQPITERSGDETMANVNDSQYTDNQLNETESLADLKDTKPRHLYSSSEIKNGKVTGEKYISQKDDLLKSEREQIEIQQISSAFALVEVKNTYDLNNLKTPVSKPSNDFDSYQTLGQFASNKILKSLLPGYDSVKSTKITFWDLASSGFKELNQITDGGYALNKETDKSGKLKRISFETPLIGFSIPIKNRQPQ